MVARSSESKFVTSLPVQQLLLHAEQAAREEQRVPQTELRVAMAAMEVTAPSRRLSPPSSMVRVERAAAISGRRIRDRGILADRLFASRAASVRSPPTTPRPIQIQRLRSTAAA